MVDADPRGEYARRLRVYAGARDALDIVGLGSRAGDRAAHGHEHGHKHEGHGEHEHAHAHAHAHASAAATPSTMAKLNFFSSLYLPGEKATAAKELSGLAFNRSP